jgi:hypothetical protein
MLPYCGVALCLNLLVYPEFNTLLARAERWLES